tara:strand:- start:68297 stop:69316 length:1020 start_codon:yes stop_codon:yes gene_type:complete
MDKKILIDSIYIHSFGGKELLEYLIVSIKKRGLLNKTVFFFDIRLNTEENLLFKDCFFYKIKPRVSSRISAYKNYSKNFKTVVCLSNIPPPYKILNKKVFIYFHNLLLTQDFSNGLYNLILNRLKKIYIKKKNSSNYDWIVQTNYMKEQVAMSFSIKKNKIKVYPFFDIDKIKLTNKNFKSSTLNFLYVTSKLKHKNLKKLISAFKLSKFNSKKLINLYITIKGDDISYENKNIKYIGKIEKKELLMFYKKSHYLIYPSYAESLGLPVLEAIKSGCNVILSNIPTFKEICNSSLFFDPKSEHSISKSMIRAVNNDYIKKSNIVVKNKIDNFIELMFKNV